MSMEEVMGKKNMKDVKAHQNVSKMGNNPVYNLISPQKPSMYCNFAVCHPPVRDCR